LSWSGHSGPTFARSYPTLNKYNYEKKEDMKKIMILSAAALMLSLAMPQFAKATNVQNASTMIQAQEVTYQEITVADLPVAVSATIAKDYDGYTIDKAFLGNDGSYKVAVTKADVKKDLFFDAKGVFVKAEKPVPVK